MAYTSLSRIYRISPSRRDDARVAVGSVPAVPRVSAAAPAHPEQGGQPDAQPQADGGRRRAGHDCDSARSSPLMRALLLALRPGRADDANVDAALERALIAFARALNQATNDADAPARPEAARAHEIAQRRAQHEQALLDAFAALLRAAGHTVPAGSALQTGLGAFLHQLARQLNVEDDRAGEATQPGSLISVRA